MRKCQLHHLPFISNNEILVKSIHFLKKPLFIVSHSLVVAVKKIIFKDARYPVEFSYNLQCNSDRGCQYS